MTTNQAMQLAKSPTTKKALETIAKFATAEAAFKQLEIEKKEAESKLIDAMDQRGINKLEGDWDISHSQLVRVFVQSDQSVMNSLKKHLTLKKLLLITH